MQSKSEPSDNTLATTGEPQNQTPPNPTTPITNSYAEAVGSTTSTEDSLATASLILGVFALCASFVPMCGVLFGVVGLVLGIKGRGSKQKSNLATIGIILSIVGVILSIIFEMLYIFLDITREFPI